MDQAPLSLRRWKRAEYERLVDLGVFEGDPVELIGGQLIVAEPQNSPHATAVGAADDALRAVLPSGFIVRAQMPIWPWCPAAAPTTAMGIPTGRCSWWRWPTRVSTSIGTTRAASTRGAGSRSTGSST